MNNNKDTFTEIYTSYQDRIYNFVYKLVGDPLIAEDITQDTFVQVYQKYDTFRGDSAILTWIYTIAKNNCYKHYNKTKKIKNFIAREKNHIFSCKKVK